MSSNLQLRIRQEVELIERFTGAYGKQFDELIGKLNANPTAADGQCLRLCVEAVNMVLCLQGQLARVLDDLSKESRPAMHAPMMRTPAMRTSRFQPA